MWVTVSPTLVVTIEEIAAIEQIQGEIITECFTKIHLKNGTILKTEVPVLDIMRNIAGDHSKDDMFSRHQRGW